MRILGTAEGGPRPRGLATDYSRGILRARM
jgi:hypothetical protein